MDTIAVRTTGRLLGAASKTSTRVKIHRWGMEVLAVVMRIRTVVELDIKFVPGAAYDVTCSQRIQRNAQKRSAH